MFRHLMFFCIMFGNLQSSCSPCPSVYYHTVFSRPLKIPLNHSDKLTRHDNSTSIDATLCRQLVGIVHAVHLQNPFMQGQPAKRILRCFKGTMSNGLVNGKGP